MSESLVTYYRSWTIPAAKRFSILGWDNLKDNALVLNDVNIDFVNTVNAELDFKENLMFINFDNINGDPKQKLDYVHVSSATLNPIQTYEELDFFINSIRMVTTFDDEKSQTKKFINSHKFRFLCNLKHVGNNIFSDKKSSFNVSNTVNTGNSSFNRIAKPFLLEINRCYIVECVVEVIETANVGLMIDTYIDNIFYNASDRRLVGLKRKPSWVNWDDDCPF